MMRSLCKSLLLAIALVVQFHLTLPFVLQYTSRTLSPLSATCRSWSSSRILSIKPQQNQLALWMLSSTAVHDHLSTPTQCVINNVTATTTTAPPPYYDLVRNKSPTLWIPILASLVGLLSTTIGLILFFYPLHYMGVPLNIVSYKLPPPYSHKVGLGWQGLVPLKRYQFAKKIIDISLDQVMPIQELFQKLDSQKLSLLLTSTVIQALITRPFWNALQSSSSSSSSSVLSTTTSLSSAISILSSPPTSLKALNTPSIRRTVITYSATSASFITTLISRLFTVPLTVRLLKHMEVLLSVKEMLLQRMCDDPLTLVSMLIAVSRRELMKVVASSAAIGFALGFIYMMLTRITIASTSSSVFRTFLTCWPLMGFVIGTLTNWIALKWLFAPLTPIASGPFIKIHGHFLARQREVSNILATYFNEKILPTRDVWKRLLQEPCLSKVVDTMTFCTASVGTGNNNAFQIVRNKIMTPFRVLSALIMTKLYHELFSTVSSYQHPIHLYTENALHLKETLTMKLSQLSPHNFKEVLHTVFRDDEIALVLLGGIMGLSVGLWKTWQDRKESQTIIATEQVESTPPITTNSS